MLECRPLEVTVELLELLLTSGIGTSEAEDTGLLAHNDQIIF
jgi:hypothetical protein